MKVSVNNLRKESHRFDNCPRCGKPKRRKSKYCFSCRYEVLKGKKHYSWKGGKEASKLRARLRDKTPKRRAQFKKYYMSEKGKTTIKTYKKKYVELKQNFILNFKVQTGCKICDEKNPFLLEFHHPKERKNEKRSSGYLSWIRIFRMIKECQLLCTNHHALEHSEKFLGGFYEKRNV